MLAVRPAAVAGLFYPADAKALRAQVADLLGPLPAAAAAHAAPPKMLLVPHAGYVYSGPVAGSAYALLAPHRDTVRRVVLLGPVHRVPLLGLAAPEATAFRTPLGEAPVDRDALRALADLPQVGRDDEPHRLEHSLEVQLPFLQSVLDRFTLLPLAVGQATPDEVAEVLERLWGGPETLIVVSTDLSHYLTYQQARSVDRDTLQHIVGLAGDLHTSQACGAHPLNGALRAARRHGLTAHVLDVRNSGDTAGDRGRVVGYAAVAFSAPDTARQAPDDADAADTDPASHVIGPALLAVARRAIATRLGMAAPPVPDHPTVQAALVAQGVCFVTLHDRRGELRGCIGALEARRALGEDVHHHALAAAFADPRFAPVTREEWESLHVEVSVLDAPQPLAARDEADALRRLRPGVDGVLLQWREQRATFLPQVWAQLPEPARFLAALKRKAGLPADFWAEDLQLACYAVRQYTDMVAEVSS